MPGLRRYQDFVAWQLAEAFNEEVHRLVLGCPNATRNFRYRDQILDASDGVSDNFVEGFLRRAPRSFALFLDYALSSLGEAERRLHQGIRKGYFNDTDCAEAFQLARRCLTAMVRLKQSQIREA